MIIIFGTRTRLTKSAAEDILNKSCPSCGGNLELHDLKRWFTLFFIPIFPFSTIESCYKCDKCEQTYKQEIKGMLASSKKDREKVKKEAQKMFAVALAACMTRMAKIDGSISKEEKTELNNISKNLPAFKNDIKKTIDKVSKAKSDEEAFDLLRKAREVLTGEGIMLIVAQVARVVLADGKIDKKEEELMKEYLLVCGLPKSVYNTVIEKVKKIMEEGK